MPTIIKPMMRAQDIATALSISVDKVYVEIREGQLQAIRVGSEYRIAHDEGVRYLESLGVDLRMDVSGQ